MFKLTITLVLVAVLAVSIEGKRGFGKKPNFNKQPIDCNSNSLPDLSGKFENAEEKCPNQAEIDAIINKFQPANADIVRSLISQMKTLKGNLFTSAKNDVIANHADLLAELQSVDPSGYAAFNALVANSGNDQTCEQTVTSMQSYVNGLNDQGKVVSRKISCWVMTNVKQNSKAVMGEFFMNNMNTFMTLKAEEGANLGELFSLLKGRSG